MKQKLWFTTFKSKKQRYYTINSMEWVLPKFLSTQKIVSKSVHQDQSTGRSGCLKKALSKCSLNSRKSHRLLITPTTLGSMMTGLWLEPRAESWLCSRILRLSNTLILLLIRVALARGLLARMVKLSHQWMCLWLSLTLRDFSLPQIMATWPFGYAMRKTTQPQASKHLTLSENGSKVPLRTSRFWA